MKKTLLAAGMLLALSLPPDALAFDAPSEWQAFMAKARYERTNEAYGALGAVNYTTDGIDAQACAASRATLDDAVRDVPVGLALRHAAMLCAEARGDESAANAQAEALSALVKHATKGAGAPPWQPAVRVVRPDDVDTYLQLAGLERRYAYFSNLWPEGSLPLFVAAFDDESRRERHIAFDWIDTLSRLASSDPLNGYLLDRHLIANAFLDAWAQDDDIASVDLMAMREAVVEQDTPTRRDRLKAAASRGGILAAQGWLELCTRMAFPGCGDGFVDAVLPFAEKGHAVSRAQLGLAYLRGIGVKADAKAARSLIEAADKTMEDGTGLLYLSTVLGLSGKERPAWLDAGLSEAEAHGSDAARAYRIATQMDRDPAAVAPAELEWLARDSNNRRGRGFALLAMATEARNSPEASQWRERAALAGDAASMRMRAFDVLKAQPADTAARARLREAALQGDALAVRQMAYDAALGGRSHEAYRWILGKVVEYDIDSILLLAGLYEDGVEAEGKGMKDAIEIYEGLHSEVPAARRRLGMLLAEGRGTGKDPARARRLLEQDPQDMESLAMLGSLLLAGRIPGDESGGRALLEKAAAAGNAEAMSSYGLWLANHEATSDGRDRGLQLMRKAETAGASAAANNLAWVQCVSRHDDVLDAKAGLEAARRMGMIDNLPSGLIDTVAACEAAGGRYADAVRLQSLAIERLPKGDAYKETRDGMQARLALYRKGSRYVEPQAAMN